MMMIYTCAVEGCGTKQARTFSKTSYTDGVVIVRCENCGSLHLVADNLGWFSKDGTNTGEIVYIETILRKKGELVHKFVSDQGIEIVDNDIDEGDQTTS